MFETIDKVKAWLNDRLAETKFNDHDVVRSILLTLSRDRDIMQIIQAVLDDPVVLQQIASQSYRHYNGFDKICLISSRVPEYKLRLHIWWPDDNITVENIHNHRWNFSSTILMGSYRSQEFLPSQEGIEVYWYEYNSPEGHDHYSMKPLGSTKLACVYDGVITAGSYYTLFHPVLHRVISEHPDITASLLIQGPSARPDVSVYSYQPIKHPEYVDSTPFSTDMLSAKLRSFLEALQHKA